MKKIITKVCALCLAVSMFLPAGQVMAEEIQKETPREYVVFSEKGESEIKHRGKTEKQETNVTPFDGNKKDVPNPAATDGRKDDFYATVNVGILSKHPEDNWSHFEDLDNKAHAQERKIVQDAGKMVKAGKAQKSSSEYKIGSRYRRKKDLAGSIRLNDVSVRLR